MTLYKPFIFHLLIGVVSSMIFSHIKPLAAEEMRSSIYKIESLSQVSMDQPEKTLFLIDLDDTILDFPHMLGAKAWRKYVREVSPTIDASQNWHDLISYFLAQNYPLATVEPITAKFIKDLQNKGYPVCGFTARGRGIWYDMSMEGSDALTIKQLTSQDIDFDNKTLENLYPDLAKGFEYFKGTFFTQSTEPKGVYLLELLRDSPRFPRKIVFIDDKLKQVQSVADVLTELGIEHECYHYSASDVKANKFQPIIANIQLYFFCLSNKLKILTDGEAALIAENDPGKDAHFYLKVSLEEFKNKFLD